MLIVGTRFVAFRLENLLLAFVIFNLVYLLKILAGQKVGVLLRRVHFLVLLEVGGFELPFEALARRTLVVL